MNTCKDCKWWANNNRVLDYSGMASHLRVCQKPEVEPKLKPIPDSPKHKSFQGGYDCMSEDYFGAVYVNNKDGIEEQAFIETGPDFGCVHWEKKDENIRLG